MSTEFDRQALVNIFVTEAADGLGKLSAVLNPRDGSSPSQDAVHAQYIVAHTLKGASSLYGFVGVAALAEVLETALECTDDQTPEQWSQRIATVRSLTDALQGQIQKIARDGNEDRDACEKWKAGLSPTSPDPGSHVLTEKALPSVLESYPDA
ncbi:MAG TPA: Hpt domain-containing protein, partial [Nitrospiraceae bacterium]|nr:Hpt domain-containing protein [Nitrospiraceae bacterium]